MSYPTAKHMKEVSMNKQHGEYLSLNVIFKHIEEHNDMYCKCIIEGRIKREDLDLLASLGYTILSHPQIDEYIISWLHA